MRIAAKIGRSDGFLDATGHGRREFASFNWRGAALHGFAATMAGLIVAAAWSAASAAAAAIGDKRHSSTSVSRCAANVQRLARTEWIFGWLNGQLRWPVDC